MKKLSVGIAMLLSFNSAHAVMMKHLNNNPLNNFQFGNGTTFASGVTQSNKLATPSKPAVAIKATPAKSVLTKPTTLPAAKVKTVPFKWTPQIKSIPQKTVLPSPTQFKLFGYSSAKPPVVIPKIHEAKKPETKIPDQHIVLFSEESRNLLRDTVNCVDDGLSGGYTNVSAVPVPAALPLMATALVIFGITRRRKAFK